MSKGPNRSGKHQFVEGRRRRLAGERGAGQSALSREGCRSEQQREGEGETERGRTSAEPSTLASNHKHRHSRHAAEAAWHRDVVCTHSDYRHRPNATTVDAHEF
jgi:hypothetical protein